MKFNSLILAAAAAAFSSPAMAADLAKRAPAAVDYVKVCDTYGSGFFYIPGTDTCLKIGGYTRFQVTGGGGANVEFGGDDDSNIGPYGRGRGFNSFDTQARLALMIDARSQTDFGLLRSFADVRFSVTSGSSSPSTSLEQAYIQWGGLTAGRAQSFFDFYTGFAFATSDGDNATYGDHEPDARTNLVAYTFGFGNGITATLSLEDPTTSGRRVSDSEDTEPYGGLKSPDFVGNIAITQGWGGAQFMAAAHNVYTNGDNDYDLDKWGYAVGAGIVFNLPMLGSNDKLALQAVYSKGAIRYASANAYRSLDHAAVGADYVRESLTKSYSLAAGFQHAFRPNIVWAVQGAYLNVDNGERNSYDEYDLATSVTWTPVNNLDVSLGLEYRSVDAGSTAGSHWGDPSKDSAWALGLRIQRSF